MTARRPSLSLSFCQPGGELPGLLNCEAAADLHTWCCESLSKLNFLGQFERDSKQRGEIRARWGLTLQGSDLSRAQLLGIHEKVLVLLASTQRTDERVEHVP